MVAQSYSCEKRCPCQSSAEATRLVVITGGPGAGKTAVLELVRKIFCENVAILPEAASILFGGGFWRLKSHSAKIAAQKAIYHVQSEMQELVIGEKKWAVALCDRGTLDGKAYWPESPEKFYTALSTSLEQEYEKYSAVIHLSTPDQKNGYNYQNPIRIESAEQAAEIDRKIHEIWKSHPNYTRIESTENFIEKAHSTALHIYACLPECCRNHLMGFSSTTTGTGSK